MMYKSLVLLAMVTILSVESMAADDAVRRPNIVFLLADDLGYTDIAPYGSEVNTPTLASLAEEGIRFSNFHTAANCAPSRAMLLTSISKINRLFLELVKYG